MSLNAEAVGRGESPAASDLRKTDLVGQLIVFSVIDFDPAEPSKFNPGTTQPRVDVDLLVVTGDLAGTRDERWRTWGNLARQMGAQPAGQATVAKVVSGPGKTPGSKFFGLDFDIVSDADLEAARFAIQQAAQPATAQPSPPAEGAAPDRVRLDVNESMRAKVAAQAAATPRGTGLAQDDGGKPPF